jgi:glycosyltransferase involved in cell wall biosynthesis
MKPLLSVIMAAYNNADFLPEAIASVQRQSMVDWELIVVDDGSTDGTADLIRQMAAQDPRIRPMKTPENLGAGAARDFALKQVHGAFVAIFDADDICDPLRFEKQVTFLGDHPDVVAVGTQAVLIDHAGQVVGTKTFPTDPDVLYRMMYTAIPIQLPSLMVNMSMLPQTFCWFEGWPFSEDTLLFFKLVQYGKIANLPDFLLKYRFHSSSVSYRNPKASFYRTRDARRLACREYGYRPTLRGRLIDGLQRIVIFILPAQCIPWVYKNIRRMMLLLSGHTVVHPPESLS